jgi:acyl-CoA synthetase (AMP-forming)/AMP-acid ligase II
VLTVPALIERAAAEFADLEAVVVPGDGGDDLRWTFADLAERAHRAAQAFLAAGVEPGDRVAIWAPNIPEWIEAVLGIHLAGGVLVPLNTRFKGPEAADILGRSRARLLLCVNGFLGTDYAGMISAERANLPNLEQVVVLRGEAPGGAVAWQDFLDRGDDAARPLPDVAEEDLSDILFTSGTTGRPKGVLATHHQSVRVFTDWSDIIGLTRGDRYLIVNPFFHTFGYKAGILASLIQGATMVPEPVFDVPTVLRRISDEQISMLPGPPTLYLSILNHPDRADYDLDSLRLIVTGAAAVPVEMINRLRTELSVETILTAYGLTESTGTVSMCRQGDAPEVISGTSGRAIPDVEVRIVDPDNVEVPRGEQGEIVVRGYNVTHGYFEDPDATAATIDADGWLHTGDIGVMDDAGNVDITDRLKDMFIVGGFNAYPAEIENTLMGHDAIAQVAVVGVPDDRMGEVGHAFVVLRPDADLDADSLVDWCRERMANYKVPRGVHIVDALPLNASGKVLKFELRTLAAGG